MFSTFLNTVLLEKTCTLSAKKLSNKSKFCLLELDNSMDLEFLYILYSTSCIALKVNWCSFEERLAAQRREREMTTAAELGFKKPLSKEEKIEKKKQRLAAIGKLVSSHV